MVLIGEGSAAADGDEAGVAVLGEDHGSANVLWGEGQAVATTID